MLWSMISSLVKPISILHGFGDVGNNSTPTLEFTYLAKNYKLLKQIHKNVCVQKMKVARWGLCGIFVGALGEIELEMKLSMRR